MDEKSANTKSPEGNLAARIAIDANTPRTTASKGTFRDINVPDGTLVTGIGVRPIWLVISGVRYGYRSWELYTRIHNANANVYTLADVDAIPEGAPFADDLELISAPNRPVFILNGGRKRGFRSEAIFNAYQCNWNAVHSYSVGVIDAIPEDSPLPC